MVGTILFSSPSDVPNLALPGGDLHRTGCLGSTAPTKPNGVAWQTNVGKDPFLPLSLAEGKIWVSQMGSAKILGLDPVTGKSQFEFEAGQNLCSSPILHRGILYFGTKRFGLAGGGSKVWGVDVSSKAEVFKESFSFMMEPPTPTVINENIFFAGATFTGFTKMILSDLKGKEVWSRKFNIVMPGTAAIESNKAFYVIYSKWGAGPTGGAFYNLNQTAVVLLGQDLTDGKVLWEYQAKTRSRIPVLGNASVMLGTNNGLVALDQASGKLLWTLEEKDGNFSAPAISNDIVVVGTQTGMVYSVDHANGKPRWKFQLDGSILLQPTIAGDIVLVAQAGKEGAGAILVALDLMTGKEVWRMATETPTTPILPINGGLLFGTTNGSVAFYR